jgi:hypothetical protein
MNQVENPHTESPACSPETPTRIAAAPSRATLLLLCLLATFALTLTWATMKGRSGIDFYQFWVVGQSIGRPGLNVYSDEARSGLGAEFLQLARESSHPRQKTSAEFRQTLQTFSSPLLYSCFRLFSTGNYETDLNNYRLLLMASLVFTIVSLGRIMDHSWSTILAAIAFFSAWFAPFPIEVNVGNVNGLQLAVLTAYLRMRTQTRWRYRDIIGGALLALVVAFKPNLVFVPATLALYWLFNRRFQCLWHHAVGGLLGGVIAIGVAAACFGSPRCWTDWLSAMRSFPDSAILFTNGNFAPAAWLKELFGINFGPFVTLLFGGSAVAGMWLHRRKVAAVPAPSVAFDPLAETLIFSIACLLVILVPRLAWMHYYVLTIPAFLLLLKLSEQARSRKSALLQSSLIVLAFAGYAMDPLSHLSVPLTTIVLGGMFVLSAVLLFALLVARLPAGLPSKPPAGTDLPAS